MTEQHDGRPTSAAPCCNDGHVCENHPDLPWADLCCGVRDGNRCPHGGCACGAGVPCPRCCTPAAPGESIMAWFTPRGGPPRLFTDSCGHARSDHDDDGCNRPFCLCAWEHDEMRHDTCGTPLAER